MEGFSHREAMGLAGEIVSSYTDVTDSLLTCSRLLHSQIPTEVSILFYSLLSPNSFVELMARSLPLISS
jgi:hypothetical protein